MRVVVVVPPEPVVTWEEASDHLRLDGDAEQRALVEGMVAAATGHIDGPDGWLGRAIGVQTLDAWFSGMDAIRLPYPPVTQVLEVGWRDESGERILDPASYRLAGTDLLPGFATTWACSPPEPDRVRVRYQVGYVTLPPAIRAAILLMTGDLFKFRETAVTGTIAGSIPMSASVEALLAPFRVWR